MLCSNAGNWTGIEWSKKWLIVHQCLGAYESALTAAGESKAIDMWLKSLPFDKNHKSIEEETEDDIEEGYFWFVIDCLQVINDSLNDWMIFLDLANPARLVATQEIQLN